MEHTLKLFAYGSLKVGECNDVVVRPFLKKWVEAEIDGVMRLRRDGYPALFLSGFGALGSLDYPSDLNISEAPEPEGGGVIRGQLLFLDQGERALEILDEFEGYFPSRDSEYLRAAISVRTKEGPVACWTYTGVGAPPSTWRSIEEWPPPGSRRSPDPYRHGL